MKKTLARVLASAFGLMVPALAFAQSYDYGYDDAYDYTYSSDLDATGAGLAAFGIGMMILFGIMVLIGLVLMVFTIWMIIDAAKRDFDQKAMWIILMVFFTWIAALVYYFMVKRKNITRAHPQGAAVTAPPAAK